MMICLMSMVLFFAAGCGFKKEVLLEHSGNEAELGSLDEDAVDSQPEAEVKEDDSREQIYVYICGQVKHPGVYQIAADARVFEVIALAGGLSSEADPTGVNQAQTLIDGQMIYIPAVGEMAAGSGNGTSLTGAADQDSDKVNINTADLETLMSLPGIGQGKAQSILDYRQEHGSFQSIEEIMNVDGIKEGTYTKFKDKITI